MLASCGKVVTPPPDATENVTSSITDATEDKATEEQATESETVKWHLGTRISWGLEGFERKDSSIQGILKMNTD